MGLTRNSVMAIVPETTEGTAVMPSASTQYVALQPDVEMNGEFEALTSEELRGSIGQSKTIQGIESGTASFSHYLRHSGTEGAVPDFNECLQSIFGSETINGTERATTTGSTVSVVNLAAGGGDFARGFAILVKDPTNGYSIRPVHSVSTNALTLGFQLANAPATGINVGKCINYSPTNSGHQSMSLHLFRGNETAYQMVTGAKCTEYSISAEAGGFINQSFSFSGLKYSFNPIEITASNKYLDFNDGGGEENAVIAEKVYRDPYELASALQTAMDALTADNITVTWNDFGANKGKFTLASDGGTFSLLWNTGANTANTIGATLGFSVAADDTGASSYNSDNELSWAAPQTPSYDSADPLVAKNNEVLLGDADDTLNVCASSITFTAALEQSDVNCISSESGRDSRFANLRTVTVEMTGRLDEHDVDKFYRFRSNSNARFMWAFGNKSGGNWVAGQCGCVYMPTSTISAFEIGDEDGLVTFNITLTGYVDSSGNGEVYMNFL